LQPGADDAGETTRRGCLDPRYVSI
jgi:hypothetical protein